MGVIDETLAEKWDDDLLPICLTRWLDQSKKTPRPENRVMKLRPEFKEMTVPIMLSPVTE